MSAIAQTEVIHHPDDDGLPMSDNTAQFDWISIIKWNLEAIFRNQPDVFLAGNHLIYPVEGSVKFRQAPDVYVALGPKKGDRGSYKVWEEASSRRSCSGCGHRAIASRTWRTRRTSTRSTVRRNITLSTHSSRPMPRGGLARTGGSFAPRK